MKTFRIALVPGDGIGKEVLPQAWRVLEQAAEYYKFKLDAQEFPWGCEYYLRNGRMMPEDGLQTMRAFQAIFLGAVGDPAVPDHVSLWGLLLPIRKTFNQYVNLRPVRLLRGMVSPLRHLEPGQFDVLFVRENTEGEYSGVGGRVHVGTPYEVAIQSNVFTRVGVERVVRHAFAQARRRNRRLASITKSNACQYSMVFWDEIVELVHRDFPDVEVSRLHVDAAAAALITRPQTFDVVVASNLFGDILTDLAGALQGSLGISPGANLNPEREHPSMFEPIHGSAPDIAGKGIANPTAAIWAGAMMLDYLGREAAANAVLEAIEATLQADVKTRDLGGRASTSDVANTAIKYLRMPEQSARGARR